MSELTTVARPYARAAFDFAVEAKAIDNWLIQLTFATEVAKDITVKGYLSGGASVEQAQTLFLNVCGEQVDSQGQNFLKVMAENERLLVLPQVLEQFIALKADFDQEVSVDVTSAVEITAEQKSNIYRIVAAVLHIGNINFQENTKDKKGHILFQCPLIKDVS